MNASELEALDELLNRLADGQLTVNERDTLSDLLRASPAARRRFRRFMALHAALQWDYAALAQPPEKTKQPRPPSALAGRHGAFVGALALAAVAVAMWWPARAPHAVIQIEALSGAVSWTDATGASPRVPAVGAILPAGTLAADGADASVVARFSDGTRLELRGESEVAVSDAGRKSLHLERGVLGLASTAQGDGQPMRIHTAAAAVEVSAGGASLLITTDAAQTGVEAIAGEIAVVRRVDGRRVKLHPAQRILASLNARAPLAARAMTTDHPQAWRRDFTTPPPANSRGEWLQADSHGPARVRAVPLVAGRQSDCTPIVHHGVTARAADGPLAALAADTVLSLRWRTAQPEVLHVLISTRFSGGEFAGNFEIKISAPAGPPSPDGWHSVTMPVRLMEPCAGSHPSPPVDALVSLLMVTTLEKSVDLEVAELSFDRPSA